MSLFRRHLSGIAGVHELNFDVFQGRMAVLLDPGRIGEDDIAHAVAPSRMSCRLWQKEAPESASFWQKNARDASLVVSGVSLAACLLV